MTKSMARRVLLFLMVIAAMDVFFEVGATFMLLTYFPATCIGGANVTYNDLPDSNFLSVAGSAFAKFELTVTVPKEVFNETGSVFTVLWKLSSSLPFRNTVPSMA